MKRRTEESAGRQVGSALVERVAQFMLPVVAGIAATKQGLLEWAHGFGLAALDELFEGAGGRDSRSEGEAPRGPDASPLGDDAHGADVWWASHQREAAACEEQVGT